MLPTAPREATIERPSLNGQLAEYLDALDYGDLTGPVIDRVKDQMSYLLGLALAGFLTTRSNDARDLARRLSPHSGPASVIGEAFQVRALDAAFANCGTINGSAAASSSRSIGTHPGLLTYPVAWALGEQQRSTGREVLVAVVAGYELAGKLGELAWAPGARTLRRQITPLGAFVPTAVAAKLLRLSPQQTTAALGYAAHFAMALAEGTTVPYYYGLVCRNGIMAALFAQTHAEITPSVLEARRGLFPIFFDENRDDIDQLAEHLDTARRSGDFEILRTKTHPGTGTVDGRTHTLEADHPADILPADRLAWIEDRNAGLLADDQIDRLVGLVNRLEDVADMCELMAYTRRHAT